MHAIRKTFIVNLIDIAEIKDKFANEMKNVRRRNKGWNMWNIVKLQLRIPHTNKHRYDQSTKLALLFSFVAFVTFNCKIQICFNIKKIFWIVLLNWIVLLKWKLGELFHEWKEKMFKVNNGLTNSVEKMCIVRR